MNFNEEWHVDLISFSGSSSSAVIAVAWHPCDFALVSCDKTKKVVIWSDGCGYQWWNVSTQAHPHERNVLVFVCSHPFVVHFNVSPVIRAACKDKNKTTKKNKQNTKQNQTPLVMAPRYWTSTLKTGTWITNTNESRHRSTFIDSSYLVPRRLLMSLRKNGSVWFFISICSSSSSIIWYGKFMSFQSNFTDSVFQVKV